MKLSICIPIYNFDVRELVHDIKEEIINHQIDAEIILIDDASEEQFNRINIKLQEKADHYIFLEKNIGRSQIRNLFLQYAQGDYLLFLDCDGKITDKNFLRNYIYYIAANPNCKIIYGGRVVSDSCPDNDHYLRWKFANERENILVKQRLERPYLSFQTNNFVIKREVLEEVRFNPEFQKYGYEDLLFAMDLKSKHFPIEHIQNPIFNNDLEENKVYLDKVKESVESLSKMIGNKEINSKLSEVKLVKAFNLLNQSFLKGVFKTFFILNKHRVEERLLKGNVSLRYLDFYKLGLLVSGIK